MTIKEFLLRGWFAGMVCFIMFYVIGIPGQWGSLITAFVIVILNMFIIDSIINAFKKGIIPSKKRKIVIGIISFLSSLIPITIQLILVYEPIRAVLPFDPTIVEPISFGLLFALGFWLIAKIYLLIDKKFDLY